MEETLKMLVEFVLERQTALEMENKRLTQQLQKTEEVKDRYYDGYARQAEQLAEIASLIRPHIEWKNGKGSELHIYDDEGLLEIIKILRIEQEDIK